MSKDNYVCYILKCGNYTYNGCTNNFKRRIRQHNGEIVGGAKCTFRRGFRIKNFFYININKIEKLLLINL